ncbi:uncharacterized protein BDR25DRAFT_266178 [Lindgomyces ingoldianus]|uniref:Uncharacterized protein n=1 Tax=Lindgomyces ingoldianus TaxID=673940 RepID=A0ACB6QLF1_9PLEO|nr:uncharacterized protein BDR25DRAFT_266178 [Lindgomyces ingoldianus]KAF2467799.1 hypothetical protein BDR25DRAFT_266178 [Lindgomyces ingoldianus]
MLSSKGLRPAHIVPSLRSHQCSAGRPNSSRQFSNIPRRAAFSAPSCRTSRLHSTNWRTGAIIYPIALSPSTTVRNGSWYAPWSWGRSSQNPSSSSTPADVAAPPSAPPLPTSPPPAEPAVISQTPELSPTDIESPADVSSGSSWYNPWSWGRSTSGSSDPAPATMSSGASSSAQEPATTSQTPELSPGTVDSTPVLNVPSSAQATEKNLEDILGYDPAANPAEASLGPIDPSQVTEHIGYLKELGLDYGWGITSTMQWMFEHIYIYSGLSWGGAIIVGTLVVRALSLYPLIRTADGQARMASISPVVKKLQTESTEAMRNNDTQRSLQLRRQVSAEYKLAGTSLFKTFGGMIFQGVLGFGAFRLLRGMASLPVPGLETAGFAWFTDLTVSDPYYILPLTVGLSMHLMARFGGEAGPSTQGATPGVKLVTHYILPFFMTTITTWQPAALQIYFGLTTILGMVLGRTLRVPAVRDYLGIKQMPTKEATAFWKRVTDGEIPWEAVKRNPDGTITVAKQYLQGPKKYSLEYKAPTSTLKKPASSPASISTSTSRKPSSGTPSPPASPPKINLRRGATMPAHLAALKPTPQVDPQTALGDYDINDGPPAGIRAKMDWYWRNYKPGMLFRRVRFWAAGIMGSDVGQAKIASERKKKARERAEEFERRRRERG